MKNNAVCYPKTLRVKFYTDKDKVIRFIQKEQLLDRELWQLFVNQFTVRNDPEKRAWRGEFWGKMMRGACMTYTYTKNRKLYSVLKESVVSFLSVQDEKGRFTTYGDVREFEGWDMWGRKYAMLGLLYFYDICNDKRLKSKILSALIRHADYIVENVGDGKKDMLETLLGKWGYGGLPASSILEPFMKLYFLTKKQSYLDFGTYIVSRGFSDLENIIEAAAEGTRYPYEYKTQKAYEMMSCFQGLLEYYKATEEKKWLNIVESFFSKVAESELTVIGGLGCDFEFFNNSVKEQTKENDGPMIETCVTVTWMNLCYHLYLLTGDSRYVDYIEQSYVNAMRGAINLNKNEKVYKILIPEKGPELFNTGGLFFPFDSYSPLYNQRRAISLGGNLILSPDEKSYGCCICIASLGPALEAATCIVKKDQGYLINVIEKCIVHFETDSGNQVTIEVKGDAFNGNGKLKYTFSMTKKEKLTFAFRIPEWSQKHKIFVNGVEAKKGKAGKYHKIEKEFCDGDFVELCLDTRMKVLTVNNKKALKKGAYILARDERYDEDFYANVELDEYKNGTIRAKRVRKNLFNTLGEYEIPLKNGGVITVCDYSSAASDWDREKKNKLNVWI